MAGKVLGRSSLHGLRYIVEPGAHWIEHLVWALLFVLSVLCTITVIYTLYTRFQTAETSTVIDTLHYDVAHVPFPSVTVCPNNRVDWNKALEMEKIVLPVQDEETRLVYRKTLTALSTINFSNFNDLSFLKNHSVAHFEAVNLTNLLRNVAPTCSEILTNCWWRKVEVPCCDIFEEQRTEYGFCYSFNSETTDPDNRTHANLPRPRRSNAMGVWGGLRATMNLTTLTQPPDSQLSSGVMISVSRADTWPFVFTSSLPSAFISMAVRSSSTYVTERIRNLDPEKRPCQIGTDLRYDYFYCMTLCRRRTIVEKCGCSPFFMLPPGPNRDCAMKDLACLAEENDIFNSYVWPEGSLLFSENATGMKCYCPTECEFVDYSYGTVKTTSDAVEYRNTIVLDVHWATLKMPRYRTDIVHTKLDLLVSFGGVVGLFIGGSLLSAVEILYYLTMGLISHAFRRTKKNSEAVPKIPKYPKEFTILERTTPSAKRITPLPDFYAGAKFNLKRY